MARSPMLLSQGEAQPRGSRLVSPPPPPPSLLLVLVPPPITSSLPFSPKWPGWGGAGSQEVPWHHQDLALGPEAVTPPWGTCKIKELDFMT